MEIQNDQTQHFIIAIGASAGAIEDLFAFFDNTSLAEASYIIIQHLSADYKSRMVEILSSHSQLKIKEAAHNMRVAPNEVYLIPSQQYMYIQNGFLQLQDKKQNTAPHKTINAFFNSLAADTSVHAIAVVLSGTGDDGSKGVVNIKKAGGLVIVQDPASAKYDNMPLNAIATGTVDHVLTPASMPAAITRYINHGFKKTPPADKRVLEDPSGERYVTEIISLIKDRSPLDFSDYKPTTILRRIKRRMAHLNFDDMAIYHGFLLSHPDEMDTLAQTFMISVSAFFRNKDAFKAIEDTVIPAIINSKKNSDEIKIWVAGCATGEEAYSLAILIHEQLAAAQKDIPVRIFATDIDKAALEFAGKGAYPEAISKDITQERLDACFKEEDGYYRIRPHIRRMLIFAQHNVAKNPPYCNMDLISCRNLLIYMSTALQNKALSMLHFGLRKDGYLFLGSSENAGILQPFLKEEDKKWKIYRNLESSRSVRFDIFTPSRMPDPHVQILTQAKKPGGLPHKNSQMEEINGILLEEGGYAGVCVDQNNNVVRSLGKVEEFLLQKIFNFDLMELLPRPLALAFVTASRKALSDNERVAVTGINVPGPDAGNRLVTMIIRPLDARDPDLRLLLVLFREEKRTIQSLPGGQAFDEQLYLQSGMAGLEEDLKQTRERLQESLDKLEASNENMQSFNEELLSTNEEMQSANEELQSVNEELQTINTDYQLKIKELTLLNDDMNNYFRSNLNGQLFVDNELLLKKFSPAAVTHINLRETDIGRPIHNITTNLLDSNLERDIKAVIATGEVLLREVESVGGKWYQMMIMPYIRQPNNVQDGTIITFNEITTLKKTQAELHRSNQTLKRINEDLDNFVHAASHDLLAPLTSIEAAIRQLRDSLDDKSPGIDQFTSVMEASIFKLRGNLQQLAQIGSIEGEIPEENQVVEIASVLKEVLLSLQDKITGAKANISITLDEPRIVFSPKDFRSILYNLISNAVKFYAAERRPEIHIATRKENGFLLLQVKDNGVGMEKGKMQNVFNIYKRLHRDAEGLGIGLYVVKKIVDAAGGMTKVESEPGVGSTFSIYFDQPAGR
ncbi:GHKL domain-containing protein [Chitinophaga agrisoli]|uniref:GHKL domain-containing protein n=1 Tax=Chitinophaga agrisoli TaxID=2607653 RepID=A0A5B2VNY7_9BACT|nr:chemotaxis protein CheB [Chitinophaga agrisoli]KAA2240765.1 GHKL domain-containing protein [Chitinophaga agrisoli]